MNTEIEQVLALLPYDEPFRFVDSITILEDEYLEGTYQIKKDEYFLRGHFKGNPVVPGVIIAEVMAQIGVVCLGIHLNKPSSPPSYVVPVFSAMKIDFLLQAYPGDTLRIVSKRTYFRLGKLKTYVRCYRDEEIIAHGDISGVVTNYTSTD